MKTLAIIALLFSQLLWSEPSVLEGSPEFQPSTDESVQNDSQNISEDSIHSLFDNAGTGGTLSLSSVTVPSTLYIGQVFPYTIKITPTEASSSNIEYTLQNQSGIRTFSNTPTRKVDSDGTYDTFYFIVESSQIRLPDITATLSDGSTSETLSGPSIVAIPLNPPSSYANVLAEKFVVLNYKTTAYNQENNIVVFTVKASKSNLGSFSLPNAIKQGFEAKSSSPEESRMTYYAVIPNDETSLSFSYFNLSKNRYESILIPIIVDDDTVSTQIDLNPTDSRHTELKVAAAGTVALMLFGLFYWRREKWFLYASAVPVFYILVALLPNQNVCVKKGSPVYLLPMHHGTIFETTIEENEYEVENEVGDFLKIQLKENEIGWVNKRDLCSN